MTFFHTFVEHKIIEFQNMNPKLPNISWQKNGKEINSKFYKQLIKWAI